VQFALVHAVATIRSRTVIHQKTIYSHLLSSFWDWDDFPSFGLATAVGLVSVFLITFTAIAFPFLFEWIGTAALLIEAMLGLPQVVKNYQRSSTEGFSWFLLGTWILGDAFKTVFFLANNTPYQFVMCGIIQLFVDAVMLAQMLIY
jgi:solute carrier family 66, member 2